MRKPVVMIFVVVFVFFSIAAPVFAADDSSKKVLKQGILGAGTGAIAAGASGGKAGKGALIGAGTGILGNVLLDVLTEDSPSEPTPRQRTRTDQVVDLYQEAYQKGYGDGFRDGYRQAASESRRMREE